MNTRTREADAGGFLPLVRGEWLLLAAFWAFIATLNAANSALDPRAPGVLAFGIGAPILVAVLPSVLWAAVTVPIFQLADHLEVERGVAVKDVALVLFVGFVLAVAIDAIGAWLRFDVFPRTARESALPFGPLVTIRHFFFLDDFIVYLAVLSAGLARSYSTRLRTRSEEERQRETETSRLQAKLAEAKLHALRAQVDPHFLFNTLHAISSLVERDPRGVRRMVARLSEMLRERMAESDEQETTLDRELASLDRYLDIMRVRFQELLVVNSEIAPDTRAALVPGFILQPIVENAIKHGLSKRAEGGVVELRARIVDDALILTVRDNGPGPAVEVQGESAGLGVRNTRERLQALYGDAQQFTLRAREGGGAEAEILLPFHTRDDLRVVAGRT